MATTSEDFEGGNGIFSVDDRFAEVRTIDSDQALLFRNRQNASTQKATANLDTSGTDSTDISFDYYELDTLDKGEGLTIFVNDVPVARIYHGAENLQDTRFEILDATKISNFTLTHVATGNFPGAMKDYGSYYHGKDQLFTVSFTIPTPGDTTKIGFAATMDQGDEGVAIDNFNAAPTPPPPCFVSGTRIATPRGEMLIEMLRPGDLVHTLDNGPQPILWCGARSVGALSMRLRPKLRPVAVSHAMQGGSGLSCFSRQHRILHKDRQHGEILSHAIHLCHARMSKHAFVMPPRNVTYHHILLSRHEIVFGNGLASESMFPGQMALASLSKRQQADIAAIIPKQTLAQYRPVRPFAKPKDFLPDRPRIKSQLLGSM